MAFRVFMVFLALANIVFFYEIYELARARHLLAQVPAGYGIGPENADITVVEFLDYACSHCRDIDPVIREAVKRDGKVRYIARPAPTGAAGALKYAQFAYAAGEQGKFAQAHDILMQDFRIMDDRRKAEIAEQLGLDLQKLNADMDSRKVDKELKLNAWLLTYFYTASLPHFVINGWIAYSPANNVPTVDDFLKMFKEARGRK